MKNKIWHSGHYRPIALLKRTHRQVKISRTRETGHVKRGKFAQHVTQTSSWVCPVDFDGRRKMSSLSLKTVVVHNSVTSLMMATNLQKGRLVHRVPCAKSREKLQEFFQSVCMLFCKYKFCNVI